LRLNLETGVEIDAAAARARITKTIEQCRPRGWHIQLYAKPAIIAAAASELSAAPGPLVLDHFAGAEAALGPRQPGFDAVLSMVRAGRAYVKLSAPYRASALPPPYENVQPLAEALGAANPERLLWGSDWPHPNAARVPGRTAADIAPALPVDDGLVLDQLPRWVPEAGIRRLVLVDNPARLYGF
jgi:predicted TIM-barrel fold metal-dependent hydrolase